MAEANRQQDEELLTAYLDGELDPEQLAQAESLIQQNSDYAQLVEAWRENGIALRGLSKFQLDAGFSDRVLASQQIAQFEKPEIASLDSLSQLKHPQTDRTLTNPTQTSPLNGLVAIAALAAMVLLTLFVFPMFVDQSEVAKVDPIVETEKTELGKTEPDKTKTKNPDVANPDVANPGDSKGRVKPPIERVERGKTLSNRGPMGAVDPIKTFYSNLPVVEQVFWIQLDLADSSLAKLQKILADNSIKIVDSEKDFSKTDDVSAIYVVASSLQMRKAIGSLSKDADASVTAFPLPMSAIPNGKAQQVSPINLAGTAEQATEIAELDRWFGLTSDKDESRPIRFLLLVGGE